MRIGYSADDSAHRALIIGLHRRWCPGTEIVEGHFRGDLKLRRRSEIPKICEEFEMKGVDVMVFLTDGDGRPWRDVQREELTRFPPQRLAMTVVGVADRNVECWICADAGDVAGQSNRPVAVFRVNDPKDAFNEALGVTSMNRKEAEISELVERAPLHRWLHNGSFRAFYEALRALSQQRGCHMENLLDRQSTP